jgi:hypothetical protein
MFVPNTLGPLVDSVSQFAPYTFHKHAPAFIVCRVDPVKLEGNFGEGGTIELRARVASHCHRATLQHVVDRQSDGLPVPVDEHQPTKAMDGEEGKALLLRKVLKSTSGRIVLVLPHLNERSVALFRFVICHGYKAMPGTGCSHIVTGVAPGSDSPLPRLRGGSRGRVTDRNVPESGNDPEGQEGVRLELVDDRGATHLYAPQTHPALGWELGPTEVKFLASLGAFVSVEEEDFLERQIGPPGISPDPPTAL